MDHDNLLLMMVRLEETIGELYAAYARRFAAEEAFWNRLAAEEMAHARWLRELGDQAGGGLVFPNEDRFRIAPIKAVLSFLEEKTAQAGQPELGLINALSIAVDLENSLLEKEFYQIFGGEAPQVQRVFAALRSSTGKHAQAVRTALALRRQQS